MLNINYKQAFLLGTLPVILISAPFAISEYKVDLLTNLFINVIQVSLVLVGFHLGSQRLDKEFELGGYNRW